MNYSLIKQTNDIVRAAICSVRIERNPATMGCLYDALNKRRNARSYVMPKWERNLWDAMEYTEMTFREKLHLIDRERNRMTESGFVTK
jgi:hypothetical protein